MVYQFILEGEVPAKKNSVKFNSKTRCTYKNERFTQWHEYAQLCINSQKTQKEPINKCNIHINLIHGDLKRRDCDNSTASIMDLLTDCGIITDDNWKVVREIKISNDYEKGNAHCIITILC